MDLLSAVAVSMLPVSRGRASAIFKELRQRNPAASTNHVLDGLDIVDGRRAEFESVAWTAAREAVAAASRAGMQAIPWFDSRYPALLNCVIDPPPVLWLLGQPDILARPTVAIIGSRAASGYALDVGRRLAAELSDHGVVVASGLARGVDSSAHRGCLDAGGGTVAVLGSGLDRIYPAEHGELAANIARQGALISELGPGGAPLPAHFPLRNRIISGISLAVVVVEANEKSGSLITARCAMEQGRDVMAVPGSVLSGRNRGSHSLLKDGAKIVETADDILEELGWPADVFGAASRAGMKGRGGVEGDPLLCRMDGGESYDLDALVASTGMAPARLLTRLMELELQGRVTRAAGGRFTRLVR